MKSIGSVIGKALLVLSLSVESALAANGDDGFAAFWTKFKAAVARSDQKAVSGMIKYPVLYIDERQEEDFPVIWKGAFGKAQRKCLAKQKPVKDTNGEGNVEYAAFCDSLIYSFGKVGADWKLTDFGEND